MPESNDHIFLRLAVSASMHREDVIHGCRGCIDRILPYLLQIHGCSETAFVQIDNDNLIVSAPPGKSADMLINSVGINWFDYCNNNKQSGQHRVVKTGGQFIYIVTVIDGTFIVLSMTREFSGEEMDLLAIVAEILGNTFESIYSLKVAGAAPLPGSNPEYDQSLAGIRILLVEDNKFNQYIAQSILEKSWAEIEIAEDGSKAVELLKIKSFDLILMDIQMPVMDGITATTIIRNQLNISTPILALSANVVSGIKEKCEKAGMQGYISKPIDENDLFSKIMAAISGKHQKVPLVDISGLKKNFGNHQEMISSLIRKFIEVTPGYVSDLKLAAENHDIIAIEDHSHKIKTSLNFVASENIRTLMNNINEIGKVGKFTPEQYTETPELYEMINSFLELFPELVNQLEKEVSE